MLSAIPESTARPLLEQANELQRILFEALVSLPANHQWGKKNSLVAAWVETLPGWDQLPQLACARFANPNSPWSLNARAVATADLQTKANMLRVWQNHRDFPAAYFANTALEIVNWSTSAAWTAARDLMEAFYGAVLGSETFPLPQGKTINRQVFLDGLDGRLTVCPYCDCGLSRMLVELDHFLPVSVFPFLSIHPDNLVPVNHYPNVRGRKGSKIPLDNMPASQPRTASQWFHPRLRTAEGLYDARVTRATGQALSVELIATDPLFAPHVRNLDELVVLALWWTEEAGRELRSEYEQVVFSAKSQNRSHTDILRDQADMFASLIEPTALRVLKRRKYEYFSTNAGELEEMAREQTEMATGLRLN
mgnify:CR=1 FL=1